MNVADILLYNNKVQICSFVQLIYTLLSNLYASPSKLYTNKLTNSSILNKLANSNILNLSS